jgi:hypothetical protein
VTDGTDSDQPNPNGPFPRPESYDKDNCGPNPDRPGLVAIGTDIAPVPVAGPAENFSPIPRIAPPPLGNEIDGTDTGPAEAAPPPASGRSTGRTACASNTAMGSLSSMMGTVIYGS